MDSDVPVVTSGDDDVPVVTSGDDDVPLPIVTGDMVEEENRLAEERARQEAAEMEEALANQAAIKLEVTAFSKLDDLLSKTQIYSQFLLEKMDDIAMVPGQEDASEEKTIKDKKPGKGNKRKPAVQKAAASRV
jgi:ATP-dependent DNA helicase